MAGPNLLDEAKKIILRLPPQKVEEKASRHFLEALNFGQPNNNYEKHQDQTGYAFCYNLQRSRSWNCALFIASFLYMYLIFGQPNNRLDVHTHQTKRNLLIEWALLALFLSDIFVEAAHKQCNTHDPLLTRRFGLKLFCTVLLVVDQIAFLFLSPSYPIRPFRFVRAFMPYFYEEFSRKALLSLTSTYKDIIAYLIFYSILIIGFAVAATQLINLAPGVQYDEYMSNYNDLGKMSFLVYVLASYDAWPDYQLKAVDANKWNYVLFVSFIFLNCFYFVTIPTTVIFNSFKSSRRNLVLEDLRKQKESLLLCYVCLQGKERELSTETFQKFMFDVYKGRPKYAGRIAYLSNILDPTQCGRVNLQPFLDLNEVFNNDSFLHPPLLPYNRCYTRLKDIFKHRLNLTKIVGSDAFEITVAAVIISNILVIALSFIGEVKQYAEFEDVFFVLFGVEIGLRMLGEGLEQYLCDRKNWADLLLFGLSLFLSIFEVYEGSDLGKLIRMVRLFRLSRLTRPLLRHEYFREFVYERPLFRKLRILFGQLSISSIVGLKMFPLFCTSFYVLSLIGMETLDNRFNPVTDSPIRYSLYDKYSSFRNLMEAHLVIVQVMIEAGWSPIVFDYSYRYGIFLLVSLFFVLIHVIVVIILVSLMKGLVGDLYETIYNTYMQKEKENLLEAQLEEKRGTKEQHLKSVLVDNNRRLVMAIKKIKGRKDFDSELMRLNKEDDQVSALEVKEGKGDSPLVALRKKHNKWTSIKDSLLQKHLLSGFSVCKSASLPSRPTPSSPHSIAQILCYSSPRHEMQFRERSSEDYSLKTSIDIDNIMRKVFLSNTNESYKKTLQYNYFHHTYSNINYKDTGSQERVDRAYIHLGHLRKAFRLQRAAEELLQKVIRTQELISKEVMGRGCVVKLVMQVDSLRGMWFVLEMVEGRVSVQFLKGGFWIGLGGESQKKIVKWEDVFRVEGSQGEELRMFEDAFVELQSFSQEETQESNRINARRHCYDLFMTPLPSEPAGALKGAIVTLLKKQHNHSQHLPPTSPINEASRNVRILEENELKDEPSTGSLSDSCTTEVLECMSETLGSLWPQLSRIISDCVYTAIN